MEPTKRPLFPIYDIMEHWAAFAHGTPEVKCQHHALYLALVNLCKVKGGSSRFALAYQHGMDISGIGSRNTYAATIKELQEWKFLTHTPGANGFKAPIIDVHFCASAEHLLSIYRASTGTSTDTSTGHNKEVIGLRVEVVDVKAAAAKLESEKLALQAELINLKAQLAAPQPEALKANPAKQMAVALTDPDDEQHWSAGPLNKPKPFKVICERLGFLEIDFEHYRKQALVAAEDADISRTINQWSSWIRNYLNNQMKAGPLLKTRPGGGTLPSQPTPDRDYPQPGHEQPGQVFYIGGSPGDQNMDRMAAAARLKYFPAATVVSLAYPQAPYTLQDGNVIRG